MSDNIEIIEVIENVTIIEQIIENSTTNVEVISSNPIEVSVIQSGVFSIFVTESAQYNSFSNITNNQTVFNLTNVPLNPSKALVYLNGQKVMYGPDFMIDSVILTWVNNNIQLNQLDTLEIYYT